jgi:hypothetical protein
MKTDTMSDVRNLLKQLSEGGMKVRWNSEDWGKVISHLQTTLQDVLPILLRFDDNPVIDTDVSGFCLEFASQPPSKETVLQWKLSGTLGMQCNGSDPVIVAAVFFAVNEQPLIAQCGQSYLELHFDLASNKWVSVGWRVDEFGEFEDLK